MFCCQDVTDDRTVAGSADSPLLCRDHSTPPLLGSTHGMGSRGSSGLTLTIFGVLVRGENCTDVHLARLIAGVQKAGLDVTDISPASGSGHVLGYEVSPANAYCSGAGGSRVNLGAQQPWSSLKPSRKFALASHLVLGELGQPCVWNKEHFARLLSLLRSD